MNSSIFYLMSMLFKSSTNKYMIMVRNIINKIIKNMIIFFFFLSSLQSLDTKIVFYLKISHVACGFMTSCIIKPKARSGGGLTSFLFHKD